MKTEPLALALEEALERVRGGATVEEATAAYGGLAAELKPLLETALLARHMGEAAKPPHGAQSRSRAQFLAASHPEIPASRRGFGALPLRVALASVVMLAVLVLGGWGTVAASASSLPGDLLYPVKLASERAQLVLTTDAAQRLNLQQAYEMRRVQEIEELIQSSRSAEVTFTGPLTEVQSGIWQVAGLPVSVGADTRVEGEVQVGTYVEVHGLAQADGTVLAQEIRSRQVRFSGKIQFLSAKQWVVDGAVLLVSTSTHIVGIPEKGASVRVVAIRLEDGGLLATSLEVVPGSAPTPTSTATPEATATRPGRTPEPGEGNGGTEAPEATESGEDHEVKEPTETPKPTEREDSHTPDPTEPENGNGD